MIVDLGVIGSHVSCPLFPPSCGVINGVETPFFFGNRRQTCRRSTHCCTTNTRMSKYEVLGVSRFASFQEIKSAYQAAALATHPDKQARIAAGALKKEVRVTSVSKKSDDYEHSSSSVGHTTEPGLLEEGTAVS